MKKNSLFWNPRVLTVLFLGFSSGLPLALTGATLQAWFTEAGLSIMTIGALSLVGVPYVWKFLWAPVIDRFVPWLGRHRGWILIAQIGLCITLVILANMNPTSSAVAMSFVALTIAFISTTQDIAIDAYRTDILPTTERGIGAASFIFAYRIAMLVSGGLVLVFADHLGWRVTYELMAGLIGLSIIATLLGPSLSKRIEAPKTFQAAVIDPFKDLLKRDSIWILLVFIVLYKIGDALALSLMTNFLLRGLGFTLTEVGLAFKTVSLIATLGGAFVGGVLLARMSLYRALFLFGFLQAISTLLFMMLAIVGKQFGFMIVSVLVENFCSGMSTTAFVTLLMALCNTRYSATQFASLSALSAVGRVFLGPVAAVMVSHLGWVSFYGWAFVASFPGLLCLALLRNRIPIHEEVFA